jgi:hypothetical protein
VKVAATKRADLRSTLRGREDPTVSFTRLPGADQVLRVDMVSTDEGCLGDTAEPC